jgi:hypothetical protein
MLIADFTHFLTDNGSIAPKEGPAKRLADYLASIVVNATTPHNQRPEEINYHKRPNRKPCLGKIQILIIATREIVWRCPVCGDQGSISHWQGSLWDCTDKNQLH